MGGDSGDRVDGSWRYPDGNTTGAGAGLGPILGLIPITKKQQHMERKQMEDSSDPVWNSAQPK